MESSPAEVPAGTKELRESSALLRGPSGWFMWCRCLMVLHGDVFVALISFKLKELV